MKLGVALSGGGVRGIAHAGALKALEDNNIKVDVIGGTSSGSLVASLYAMGYSPYYIYILFKKYAKELVEINSTPIISGVGNFMFNKKGKQIISVIIIVILILAMVLPLVLSVAGI